MIGFAIGYVFGTRAGAEAYGEMVTALKTITTSGEMKEMAAGAISLLADVMKSGTGALSEGSGAKLRRIA
jgi:hypothetical protein